MGVPCRELSLLQSLDEDWLKLPLAIMADVGPAVQTVGGLLRITSRETFSPVATIATAARLPTATVRKHLATLADHGWIDHRGRERTRRGHFRRTATLRITAKAREVIRRTVARNLRPDERAEHYGILPWWACCLDPPLPWCAKAVLSVVMAELAKLRLAAQGEACGMDSEDLIDAIENLGLDRFRFSRSKLAKMTGLTLDSILSAKWTLAERALVKWYSSGKPESGEHWVAVTDRLVPNLDWRVRCG